MAPPVDPDGEPVDGVGIVVLALLQLELELADDVVLELDLTDDGAREDVHEELPLEVDLGLGPAVARPELEFVERAPGSVDRLDRSRIGGQHALAADAQFGGEGVAAVGAGASAGPARGEQEGQQHRQRGGRPAGDGEELEGEVVDRLGAVAGAIELEHFLPDLVQALLEDRHLRLGQAERHASDFALLQRHRVHRLFGPVEHLLVELAQRQGVQLGTRRQQGFGLLQASGLIPDQEAEFEQHFEGLSRFGRPHGGTQLRGDPLRILLEVVAGHELANGHAVPARVVVVLASVQPAGLPVARQGAQLLVPPGPLLRGVRLVHLDEGDEELRLLQIQPERLREPTGGVVAEVPIAVDDVLEVAGRAHARPPREPPVRVLLGRRLHGLPALVEEDAVVIKIVHIRVVVSTSHRSHRRVVGGVSTTALCQGPEVCVHP